MVKQWRRRLQRTYKFLKAFEAKGDYAPETEVQASDLVTTLDGTTFLPAIGCLDDYRLMSAVNLAQRRQAKRQEARDPCKACARSDHGLQVEISD